MGHIGFSVRFVLVALCALGHPHRATGADLVIHNGFEACWSRAVTDVQFYGLMQSAIEGTTICVPPQSGGGGGATYSACDAPACPGGASGCPITLHSGPFSGNLAGGAFEAAGSADDVNVDVAYQVLGIPGSCTVAVGNITLTYSLGYTMQVDGNNGLYAASLDQAVVTVANDYTVDPGTCATLASLIDSLLPAVVGQVESEGAAVITELETPATVGDSLCPVP